MYFPVTASKGKGIMYIPDIAEKGEDVYFSCN